MALQYDKRAQTEINSQPSLKNHIDKGSRIKTIKCIGDLTLTREDSGSVVFLGDNTTAGAATTLTLPAVEEGLSFEVVVTSASITYDVAIVAADADTMNGFIQNIEAIALSTTDTYTDAAVNAAVNALFTAVSAADQVLLDISANGSHWRSSFASK